MWFLKVSSKVFILFLFQNLSLVCLLLLNCGSLEISELSSAYKRCLQSLGFPNSLSVINSLSIFCIILQMITQIWILFLYLEMVWRHRFSFLFSCGSSFSRQSFGGLLCQKSGIKWYYLGTSLLTVSWILGDTILFLSHFYLLSYQGFILFL